MRSNPNYTDTGATVVADCGCAGWRQIQQREQVLQGRRRPGDDGGLMAQMNENTLFITRAGLLLLLLLLLLLCRRCCRSWRSGAGTARRTSPRRCTDW